MKCNYEVVVLDVESTGFNNHPVHKRPQVIELTSIGIPTDIELFKQVLFNSEIEDIIERAKTSKHSERFLPSMPIHPEAIKVHGILAKDLFGCRKEETLKFSPTIKYMIGHNISYDHRCLGKPDVKLICTKELAIALDKHMKWNLTSHRQDDLIVHFYGEEARKVVKDKHDSFTDTVKTIMLLKKFLPYLPAVDTWEKLHEFQNALKGKKK